VKSEASSGRTALITGASRGIGKATALGAARTGYDVCVNYIADRGAGEEVAEACRLLGVNSIAVQADVADRSKVEAMFEAADQSLAPLGLDANNAGIIGKASRVEALDQESLHRTFAVNVYGAIYCAQEAIARMSKTEGGAGGSIVNVSSIAATLGSPGEYVHYAASKGAIETFTVGLAKEVAQLGIRVNAVQAGTTDTEIHARAGNPDRPTMVAKTAPLGRVASPDDIARAILWLASDEADYTTGVSLRVGGGL
jgi:NAD(P)-dependent dehydrogenase (short-subunit alcohol dehydrogenase family)